MVRILVTTTSWQVWGWFSGTESFIALAHIAPSSLLSAITWAAISWPWWCANTQSTIEDRDLVFYFCNNRYDGVIEQNLRVDFENTAGARIANWNWGGTRPLSVSFLFRNSEISVNFTVKLARLGGTKHKIIYQQMLRIEFYRTSFFALCLYVSYYFTFEFCCQRTVGLCRSSGPDHWPGLWKLIEPMKIFLYSHKHRYVQNLMHCSRCWVQKFAKHWLWRPGACEEWPWPCFAQLITSKC